MSGYGVGVVALLAAIVVVGVAAGPDPYGLSLVKPFQPDNWLKLGNPVFNADSLLLTSGDRPGPQRAAVWNPNPFVYRQAFTITMRTKIQSGDESKADVKTGKGLGLWLLEKPDGAPVGELGDVYGSRDMFRGLGIVFDTIDDDNRRNNPSISAHYLNGTVPYSHFDDGIKHQLAGCRADYRRNNVVATQVKYDGAQLSVFVDLNGKGNYQRCLAVPLKMRTDRDWYLGVSAETIASQVTQEVHEVVDLEVSGTPDWGARASSPQQQQQQQQQAWNQPPSQQQAWQQPPPPQQQQQTWQQPPQQQASESAPADATAETLHEKIDQLMKATTHTALESQQAGEALKEVQTNVLQKIQQATNTLGRTLRGVDQSLAQHVSSTAQQLQSLAKSIESTKASVDAGRVDTERRVNAIDAQIATLQGAVKDMTGVVERLSKSFQSQISREFGKGASRLAAAASKRSDWNVWVFIILFQVVFVGFLVYRSLMKRKLDKLL